MTNKELHRVSITGIIYKKEGDTYKYLITKRSPHKKAFPNKWTVPGGGLKTDDYTNTKPNKDGLWYFAVVNALKREIKEEVNLEVDNIEYLLDIAFINKDTPTIILSFFCEYKGGEVVLDEDSTEYKWIKAEEAKSYDLIDGIADEILMVDKLLLKRGG